MTIEASAFSEADDAQLLAQARDGDVAAFGALFTRHRVYAMRVARSLTDRVDPEDIVNEAFARTFAALRSDGGPTSNFRAYLLTAVQRQAIDQGRNQASVIANQPTIDALAERPADPDAARAGSSDELHRALLRLPERWRLALWKTEVEGVKPRELADELHLSANATSALIYRAREGLREAYLLEHVGGPVSAACAPIVELLPAYLRGNLPARRNRQVADHVAGCVACTQRLVELARLNKRFAALVLGPALVGLTSALAGSETVRGHLLPLHALRRVGAALLRPNVKLWSAAVVVLVFGAGAAELLHASNGSVRGVALPPPTPSRSAATGPMPPTMPTSPSTQSARRSPVATPTRPASHSSAGSAARSSPPRSLPVASLTSPAAPAGPPAARPQSAAKPSAVARRAAVVPAKSSPTVIRQPAVPATTSVTNEVNDNSSAITYAGTTWSSAGGRGLGDFDDDVHETTTDGESATLTFTGTGVSFITEMYSDEGDLAISIDGGGESTVNTNSATRKVQQTVFTVSALANGTHTITVTKVSGQLMVIDAFKVTTVAG